MKPNAFFRQLLLGSALGASSASAQTTYAWANSNVAGTPAANLDWFTGGSNTQGTWNTTPVSGNTNTIRIFQDTTTALTNTATPSAQTIHLNNGGTAFQLGTLTLNGRGSATTDANLTMNLSGDALNFSAATGTINLSALNATRTITYNVGNNIQLGTASSLSALSFATNGTATFNFSGIISQLDATKNSTLTKGGTSTLALSNSNNSYTGGTIISGGTLVISKISNGGSNSSIGASSNAVANLRLSGGATLRYVGTGDSSDRLFRIDGSSASGLTVTLDASGAGALKFTNTGTFTNANSNQLRTLKLAGNSTHDNTLAYSLVDNGSATLSVTKEGTGTWVLTGSNSYTGNTQVDSGLLVFARTAAKASATVTTAAGGSVGLGVGGAGYYSAADVGDLFNSTLTGFTLNASSGVAIDTTNAVGTFDQNIALTASRALTKLGVGTLILSQTNTYTGATNVTSGSLIVNGNISTSALTTVKSGATLGGSGTVGDLTIDSGGFFSPGNSPGITTVDGDYLQNGILQIEIEGLAAGNGTGFHDQVLVNGGATLNGALSLTSFSGFTPVNGDLIFILLNDGVDAISGNFTGLVQGAVVGNYLGFDWKISYTGNSSGTPSFTGGNDIVLMAVPEPRAALLGGLGFFIFLRRRRTFRFSGS